MKRGTLAIDGDTATLTFHRVLDHPPEHVWEAIATPEGLCEWLLCTDATIEGRVGGRFDMTSGPPRYRSTGMIRAWDPPRVLEYEWNVAPLPEMPTGERAIFRFELAPHGTGTNLTVIYRRLTLHSARGFLPGLHAFLDRLAAHLAGAPLPDWMARFTELHAEYPEWTDAAAAGQ